MRALLFFRHGEAAVNRPDLFVPGPEDSTFPLTETGVAQARRAGRWADETFEWARRGDFKAATSEFLRARETYRIMALPGRDPVVLPGLNEQDWGDFMSPHPPESLRAAYDADYERLIDLKAPNGESTLDLYVRARAALLNLALSYADDNLLIVTHGRTIITLRMAIEGILPTDAGWRDARRRFPEMLNCGAVYYPDFRTPGDDFRAGSVATIVPLTAPCMNSPGGRMAHYA